MTIARVFVFAFDLTEASQVRRIQSLADLGHDVSSAAFRRGNMNADFEPNWHNVDLGHIENESYAKRLIAMLRAIWRLRKSPGDIAAADVLIARNFDLLAIAWMMRLLLRQRSTPLVYECLDIHGLFTRQDRVGGVMRWLERRLLGTIQLLIVSSPGFLRNYFHAVQGYRGAATIIENKLWFENTPVARPAIPPKRAKDAPLTIGWVGSIRCAPSLKILTEMSDALGTGVQVNIHGNVHQHALPGFNTAIYERSNITYFGPYSYPDGLAEVYSGCDLVWAQDLWQRGANSDWLLPNRIYEASWFGCPSIALADTETGRRVASGQLGLTIDEPSASSLVQALQVLRPSDISKMSRGILQQNDDLFRLRSADVSRALSPVLPAK
ncbi:MAG: glycosyltransferase [Sulfitobacter sp.]